MGMKGLTFSLTLPIVGAGLVPARIGRPLMAGDFRSNTPSALRHAHAHESPDLLPPTSILPPDRVRGRPSRGEEVA